VPWALVAGFFAIMLGLNRPNFAPGALLVPVLLLFCVGPSPTRKEVEEGADPPPRDDAPPRRRLSVSGRGLALAAAFCVVFFGIWSVWIGRNLVNYGAFVPTASSNGQPALWEYGGGPVKVGRYDHLTLSDGSTFSDFGHIMEETGRYPFDYQAAKRLNQIAGAWYLANWQDLPRVFLWRLKHMVANRGASGLTRLSREDLFFSPAFGYNSPFTQLAWINLMLVDKTPTVCLLALAGVLLLIWRAPAAGLILGALCVTPWLVAAAVIGYERVVESLIGLMVWLALFAVAEIAERFRPVAAAPAS